MMASSGNSGNDREQERNALVATIENLSVLSEEQHAFKEGMKHILSSIYMSSTAAFEAVIELFPPEMLVSSSTLRLPLLYLNFRAVLRFCGLTVEQRQRLHISQAIINCVYSTDPQLLNTANAYLAEFKLSTSRSNASAAFSSNIRSASHAKSSENESDWRKIDAVNRRFMDSEKYSGILAESSNLAEAQNAYFTNCTQKGFLRSDRVKLISSMLKGPALIFWSTHVQGRDIFTEIGAVFKDLEDQFDTPAHQRQIESLTNSLTIEAVRKQQTCSRVAALGFLYHEVSRPNEQFPKVKRGDAFRTQVLMKIVEKCEWSRTAEEKVMQEELKYDEPYTHLSASAVIWKNDVRRVGQDPDLADDRRKSQPSTSPFTEYGAHYANPVSKTKSRQPYKRSAAPPFTSQPPPLRRQQNGKSPDSPFRYSTNNEFETRCFKCGRTGHWRAQCTYNDGNTMLQAARSRIRDIGGPPNAAAAKVLYEILQEEEDLSHSGESQDIVCGK